MALRARDPASCGTTGLGGGARGDYGAGDRVDADRVEQPGQADQSLSSAKRRGHLVGHPAPETRQLAGQPPRLLDQARHPDALEAAGHHPAERLQVVLDVDGEPVRRDAALHVHADRSDLAFLDPHAGEIRSVVVAGAGIRDALCAERGHDRLLKRAHVRDDVVDPDDRIADELTGSVVGDLAAPVGLDHLDPLHPIPVLAHRQLTRSRPPAPGVDGVMLEQQHHIGDRVPLAGRPDALLELERLAVLDRAQMTDPQLAHATVSSCRLTLARNWAAWTPSSAR